jgi:4'-phosphopantetheinyl transferase
MASAQPPTAPVVRVWHAHTRTLASDNAAEKRALTWLSPGERDRYHRYRRDADRAMFLLGRVMARALVGRALGVAPLEWTWREGVYGRPEVEAADSAGGRACSFNLAHSGGLVVCGLAETAAVGVDVEDRGRVAVDRRVVRRFCAPREIADIESRGETGWHDRFLEYWTLKEAYLKARGVGIAVPLADLSFSLAAPAPTLTFLNGLADTPHEWAFHLDEIGDRHYVAVSTPVSDMPPTFRVAPFPHELLP